MGLSGRVPRRVDAATKAALLDLLDQAVEAGLDVRRRPRARPRRGPGAPVDGPRGLGELADRRRADRPMHGLLDAEAAEILAVFEEWGEIDRSHRKLAHRGSYLGRVWVSPSTVRRVLFLADKHSGRCHGRAGRSAGRSRSGPSTAELDLDLRHGAPRGALEPCGGERPPPLARRSGPVKLGAA